MLRMTCAEVVESVVEQLGSCAASALGALIRQLLHFQAKPEDVGMTCATVFAALLERLRLQDFGLCHGRGERCG